MQSLPASLQPATDETPLEAQTLPDLLAARAAAYGEDTFVVYGPADRAVSFAELDRVARTIGHSLAGRGVGPGDRVGVMVEHPLTALYALVGIAAAGGVYAPINVEYKGRSLAYQLDDSAPTALVIEDRYTDRLDAVTDEIDVEPHVVVSETAAGNGVPPESLSRSSFAALREGPADRPAVDYHWSDPLAVMYTSGTTGQPKGCLLPHRWVFANFALFRYAIMNRDDAVHAPLPLYHISATFNAVAPALMAGARVILWDGFSASSFWDRIDRYGVTVGSILSVMRSWLAAEPERADDHAHPLCKVNIAPMPADLSALAERFGFELVTGQYGQTECGSPLTGVVNAARGEHATPADVRRGLPTADAIERIRALELPVLEAPPDEQFIGQPTPMFEVAIVDEHDELLPAGEVGQIVVRPRRPGVVLDQYLNAPEQTLAELGNLWWHTGDAGYRNEAGYYFFVDRMGSVIRRRGENISSAQIEDAITAHDAVVEAAAVPIPAPEGGEDEIAVAVQLAAGETLTADELRTYLEPRLPAFMLPAEIAFVDDLPTTETNKIEKYKLRERWVEEG